MSFVNFINRALRKTARKLKLPSFALVPSRSSVLIFRGDGSGSEVQVCGRRDPESGQIIDHNNPGAVNLHRSIFMLADPELVRLVDTVMAARGIVHPENVITAMEMQSTEADGSQHTTSQLTIPSGMTPEDMVNMANALLEKAEAAKSGAALVNAARQVH